MANLYFGVGFSLVVCISPNLGFLESVPRVEEAVRGIIVFFHTSFSSLYSKDVLESSFLDTYD